MYPYVLNSIMAMGLPGEHVTDDELSQHVEPEPANEISFGTSTAVGEHPTVCW